MSQTELERDKTVSRAIHSLFWQAIWRRPATALVVLLLHLPSFFVFNVFIPLQVAYGIQAIITRNFDQVGHQALIILISSVSGSTIFAIATWANHRLNVYGGSFVQRAVFANFLNKDYDFYSNRYIGALGADSAALRTAFQDYELIASFDIPKILVVIFVGIGVIIYKSLTLGLITAGIVLVIVGATIYFSKFRLKYRRALSQASSRLAGKLGDPLSHGATVKTFAQEDYEQERLGKPLKQWEKAQLLTFDTSIPHSFMRHTLLAIAAAGLLLVSAYLYKQGTISIAVVALVQLYVIRVINTTLELGEIIKRYEALMNAAYEPVATMLITSSINDPNEPKRLNTKETHAIKFENVTYHYPEAAKAHNAISDFTLSVQPGEKIGLVGHSGGGKTTLTKLLLRFIDVTDGSISVDGVDLREMKQADLRKLIAYVPQEPLLFHRSIEENIAYARPEASRKDIITSARTAFVDDFVTELPKGYKTMVGERGVKLSGGQRQRVAIARALLKDAPILVLDEATSALDSQSEQYVQKAIWNLMKDRTAIVIAHRLSTIQRLDRIVVLDKGKIVQVGTHKELLTDKNGIYGRLWAHQSGGYLAEA